MVVVDLLLRGKIGRLDIGHREEDRGFSAEALHKFQTGYAVDVAFKLEERLDSGFAIDVVEPLVAEIGKRIFGDEKLDGSQIRQADKADAVRFGDPIGIAALESDAWFCHSKVPTLVTDA